MSITLVPVALPAAPHDRSYDILIGQGLLARAGEELAKRLGHRQCLIITDDIVAPLYLSQLERALRQSGHSCLQPIIIQAGETHKHMGTFTTMADQALAQQPDRKLLIIALGGGVVGDMAGMLAGLLLRGVDYIQIPTTLLAQVDSSVGGKTGIDTAYGKNLLGVFHQPRLVIADSDVLASLPRRQRAAGFAEIIKYGLINQPDFFCWCETNGAAVVNGDVPLTSEAVRRSCLSKASIVAADEKEAGARALLNLGHSFGHALESLHGYGDTLLHGEAVAIGCGLALRFSMARGLCPPDALIRYQELCKLCDLPVEPPARRTDIPRLMQFMAGDKKNSAGNITLILLHGIGEAFIAPQQDSRSIQQFWHEQLS